ncbi:hypothetical protein C0J52_00143 [Blattella germanica]|nr:hypothetical protein C0J52_00143 [Blattella germanica]
MCSGPFVLGSVRPLDRSQRPVNTILYYVPLLVAQGEEVLDDTMTQDLPLESACQRVKHKELDGIVRPHPLFTPLSFAVAIYSIY